MSRLEWWVGDLCCLVVGSSPAWGSSFSLKMTVLGWIALCHVVLLCESHGLIISGTRLTKQHNATHPRQLFSKKNCLRRDSNPRRRQMLYQLSYRGSSAGWGWITHTKQHNSTHVYTLALEIGQRRAQSSGNEDKDEDSGDLTVHHGCQTGPPYH